MLLSPLSLVYRSAVELRHGGGFNPLVTADVTVIVEAIVELEARKRETRGT
jgi:hypothetical protein